MGEKTYSVYNKRGIFFGTIQGDYINTPYEYLKDQYQYNGPRTPEATIKKLNELGFIVREYK